MHCIVYSLLEFYVMKYFFFWIVSVFPVLLALTLQKPQHFLLAIVSLSICSISEQLPKLADSKMNDKTYFIFIYFVAIVTCIISSFIILK